ncbi:unnamed protein product [Adineta ricciae]|uniref:3'-5' exonuclease domain-containing protein n=3 Tax=Adineta ricciae TaxID=249248 RepID=A0A815Q993_ADIRI|nr:unnamed protein product [Adineta ricciae]
MNADEIRFLSYYLIPTDWKIHLIDPRTNETQLEQIQQIIENAQLFAFDTETMPSFYHPNFRSNYTRHSTPYQCQSNSCVSKPSLLQVAVRSQNPNMKNVLLFDLQEVFVCSNMYFRECSTSRMIHHLIQLIFNHPYAFKLSQSIFNDLAHLKCSYVEHCFHQPKLLHVIELSDLYRKVFPQEKEQQIYSLQRMTAMTLHCQLDKRQQCANWSKRPLGQALKDYAAIDVIVMIDIYDRLKVRILQNLSDDDNNHGSIWNDFRSSIESSIDLNAINLYPCICGEQFITTKSRKKHARTCLLEQQRLKQEANTASEKNASTTKKPENISKADRSTLPELDFDAPPPRGRGYLPPALKRVHQSMNQIPFYNQVRCSSSLDEFKRISENRPPDAQFFLEDDDTEVAQAFGLQTTKDPFKRRPINSTTCIPSTASSVPVSKSNLKVAAYPPKTTSSTFSSNLGRTYVNEDDLLDRLRDDFDSQPDFHCHLFGLGGRGRPLLSTHRSPPDPSIHSLEHSTQFCDN